MCDFAYTVAATFSNEGVAEEWVRWLREGHVAEVVAAGATDGEIIEIDGPDRLVEVRYHFPTRQAFAVYEREHAPRLRAEGLKRFGAERGIAYRRSAGDVIARFA